MVGTVISIALLIGIGIATYLLPNRQSQPWYRWMLVLVGGVMAAAAIFDREHRNVEILMAIISFSGVYRAASSAPAGSSRATNSQ